MAKIYTRTGDYGETGLYGGGRVAKDDLRIEAIGDVDELNAALGVMRMELARAADADPFGPLLSKIQHHLFDIGAELATLAPQERGTNLLNESHIAALEAAIDSAEANLPPLTAFILPGGAPAAAWAHLARATCRRAERRIVALRRGAGEANSPVRGEPLRYLNRLSDLLFVLARAINRAAATADSPWEPS